MARFDLPRVRPGGSLFSDGTPSWHDAILSKFNPTWSVYTEGYRLAADGLVSVALVQTNHRDFLIFPILFLYRQFLELSLKEIVIYARQLAAKDAGKPFDHRLEKVWSEIGHLMKTVGDGSVDKEVAVIENVVREFAALDPTSQLFRYPEGRDRTPVGYPCERINLKTFRGEMCNAGTAISIVSGGLSALVDIHNEAPSA